MMPVSLPIGFGTPICVEDVGRDTKEVNGGDGKGVDDGADHGGG